MPRLPTVALCAVFVVAGVLVPARLSGVWASHADSVLAKKVCKTVKRHGKKKKVCKTVKPKPTAKPTRKPTHTATTLPNDLLAKQLADRVYAASSDQSRRDALIAVAKAINLGVYHEKTGDPIAQGAEQSGKDFYLYDFELTSLVGGFDRKETRGIDDVARLLTAAGVKPKDQPVDPEGLRQFLLIGIKGAMAHPSDPLSRVPLLIRELGLRHDQPYDLAQDVPMEKLRLDPLQHLLISYDLLGGIVHRAVTPKPVFERHIRPDIRPRLSPCELIKALHSPFNPNIYSEGLLHYVVDEVVGENVAYFVEKAIEEFATKATAEAVTGAFTLIYVVLSAIHGGILAWSVGIEAKSQTQDTHYGPPRHAPKAGDKMEFKVRVFMKDDLSEEVSNCINEAGFTMPLVKKGDGLPGVPVDFHNNSGEDLEKYGTITYGSGGGLTANTVTDAAGEATMTFTPKEEKVPGFGHEYTKQGGIVGRALWGQYFGNILGTINQLLTPMLSEEMFWTVSYHKPRGFKFEGAKFGLYLLSQDPLTCSNFQGGPCRDTVIFSGHICGDDPHASNWAIHFYYAASVLGSDGDYYPVALDFEQPYTSIRWIPPSADGTTPPKVEVHFDPTPAYYNAPSTVTAEVSPDTVTVPVTEDTSCPDNSDEG